MGRAARSEVVPAWSSKGYGSATYIVGIAHHATGFRRAVKALGGGHERPSIYGGVFGRCATTAVLVPEPTNRHDPNAVQVNLGVETVGYLPKEISRAYSTTLSPLAQQGQLVSVPAEVAWGNGREGKEEWVRLALPEPHLLLPANAAPAMPFVRLPGTNRVKVPGVDGRAEVLAPLVAKWGESLVYATLHEVSVERARSSRHVAEVRIDGAAVGQLSDTISGHVLGVVHMAAELGVTVAVDGWVRGNSIESGVVVWLTNTSDLSESWLGELRRLGVTESESKIESAVPAAVTSQTTAAASELPPADWYPDPDDATQYRFWDGSSWTEHVAPR